jgi:1-acyl-sn-glycerol-3-phosphate acyltransferase
MRPYYRFAYTLVGLHLRAMHRIRIEGKENVPDDACLIVGNHASYMDPTTIGWAVPREISSSRR